MVYFGCWFKSLSSMMSCSHLALRTSVDKCKLLQLSLVSKAKSCCCLARSFGAFTFCFFWMYFWYKWFILGSSPIRSLR
ncbi:hypothetical protein EUGRSUZ_F01514 [Eucalyptus grandis]|uniref:Uncharacterized protein n=2 Tax=Eucalyptus grandis TaxID=71139 RepID=A0A059BNH6_EUCGR|nr:hypothetical protein EUGRSUZ_F01514 [Eucalyptus grandis]